ncbi:MAG TPA: hypothetical protein DCG34_10555 [Clostridiales bacterium]|jgi:hypothetical protein|nr:hypothetical protein [Clostridiales bacterium]
MTPIRFSTSARLVSAINKSGIALLLFLFLLTSGCVNVGQPPILTAPLKEPSFNAPTPIKFNARNPWNDQGVSMVKGHTYKFYIKATNWYDGGDPDKGVSEKGDGIPSSETHGWEKTPSFMSKLLKPMSFLRRCPEQPWYALVGAIQEGDERGGDTHCFLIGKGEEDIKAVASGRLYVFANDSYKKTYDNNFGVVDLTVIRIK